MEVPNAGCTNRFKCWWWSNLTASRNCTGNPYASVWQREVGNYEPIRGKPPKKYMVVIWGKYIKWVCAGEWTPSFPLNSGFKGFPHLSLLLNHNCWNCERLWSILKTNRMQLRVLVLTFYHSCTLPQVLF